VIKAQPALPSAFHRLWAADALSTAGDGFTLVAAPLLMLTLTNNPILISGSMAAQQLPWLLFGLTSGAIVDRFDQPSLLRWTDSARAVLMAALAVAVWTDTASVLVVYVLLFLSGLGDTVVTTAATAYVPTVVERHQLTRANARLLSTRLVGGALLARPVGAWLFTRGEGTPFAVDAVSFAVGVALLVGLPRSRRTAPVATDPGAPTRRVRQGLHLLWADVVLRTLALCIFVMNVTLAAVLAVLVLVARDRLGLGPAGYGLLLGSLAVGGLIGTAVVNRLLDRFGTALLLKAGLLIEAGTHLSLALTHSRWVAGVTLSVFGIHSAVWSVLTLSLRQHRISDEARGRVSAAYMVLSVGGAALGAVLGGLLVNAFSLTTPMWVAFVVVLGVFAVSLPALRQSSIADDTESLRPSGSR
jgi:MFS family permease